MSSGRNARLPQTPITNKNVINSVITTWNANSSIEQNSKNFSPHNCAMAVNNTTTTSLTNTTLQSIITGYTQHKQSIAAPTALTACITRDAIGALAAELPAATSQVLDNLWQNERRMIIEVLQRDKSLRQRDAARIMEIQSNEDRLQDFRSSSSGAVNHLQTSKVLRNSIRRSWTISNPDNDTNNQKDQTRVCSNVHPQQRNQVELQSTGSYLSLIKHQVTRDHPISAIDSTSLRGSTEYHGNSQRRMLRQSTLPCSLPNTDPNLAVRGTSMSNYNKVNLTAPTSPHQLQNISLNSGAYNKHDLPQTNTGECDNYILQSQQQQIPTATTNIDKSQIIVGNIQRLQVRKQSTPPINPCQPQLYMSISPKCSYTRSPERSHGVHRCPTFMRKSSPSSSPSGTHINPIIEPPSLFDASHHRSKILPTSPNSLSTSSLPQQYSQQEVPGHKSSENDELDQVMPKPRMLRQATLPNPDQHVKLLPTSPPKCQTSPQYRRSPEFTRQQTLPNLEASSNNSQTLHPPGASKIDSQAKFIPISPRQKNNFLFPNARNPRPFLSQQNVPTAGITDSGSSSEHYSSSQSVNIHQSRDHVKMIKIRSHSNEEYTISKPLNSENRRLLPEIPSHRSASRFSSRLVRQECVVDEFHRHTFGEAKQQFKEFENVTEEGTHPEYVNYYCNSSSNFSEVDKTQYENNYNTYCNSDLRNIYNDCSDDGSYTHFQPVINSADNVQVVNQNYSYYAGGKARLNITLSGLNACGAALPRTPQMHNRLRRRQSRDLQMQQEEIKQLTTSETAAIVTELPLTVQVVGIRNVTSSRNKPEQMRSISEDSGMKPNTPKVVTKRSLSHPEKETQIIKKPEPTKIPSPKPLSDLIEKSVRVGTKIPSLRRRNSETGVDYELQNERRSSQISSKKQVEVQNGKHPNGGTNAIRGTKFKIEAREPHYFEENFQTKEQDSKTEIERTPHPVKQYTTLGDQEIQNAVEAAAVIFKKVVLQRRQEKKASEENACDLETPSELEFKSIIINHQKHNTEADEFKIVFLNSDSSSSEEEGDYEDNSSTTSSSTHNCNSIKIDDFDWDYYYEPMMLYKHNVVYSPCSSPSVSKRNKSPDLKCSDSTLYSPLFHRKQLIFYPHTHESNPGSDEEILMEGESSSQTNSENHFTRVRHQHMSMKMKACSKIPAACSNTSNSRPGVLSSNTCICAAKKIISEAPQPQYIPIPVPVTILVPMTAFQSGHASELLSNIHTTRPCSNLSFSNIDKDESLYASIQKLWGAEGPNLLQESMLTDSLQVAATAAPVVVTAFTNACQPDLMSSTFNQVHQRIGFRSVAPSLKSPNYSLSGVWQSEYSFGYDTMDDSAETLTGISDYTDLSTKNTNCHNNHHQHNETAISSLPDRGSTDDNNDSKQITAVGSQKLASVLTKSSPRSIRVSESADCAEVLSALQKNKPQRDKQASTFVNQGDIELVSDEHFSYFDAYKQRLENFLQPIEFSKSVSYSTEPNLPVNAKQVSGLAQLPTTITGFSVKATTNNNNTASKRRKPAVSTKLTLSRRQTIQATSWYQRELSQGHKQSTTVLLDTLPCFGLGTSERYTNASSGTDFKVAGKNTYTCAPMKENAGERIVDKGKIKQHKYKESVKEIVQIATTQPTGNTSDTFSQPLAITTTDHIEKPQFKQVHSTNNSMISIRKLMNKCATADGYLQSENIFCSESESNTTESESESAANESTAIDSVISKSELFTKRKAALRCSMQRSYDIASVEGIERMIVSHVNDDENVTHSLSLSQSPSSSASSHEDNGNSMSRATTESSYSSESVDTDDGIIAGKRMKKRHFSNVFVVNRRAKDRGSSTETDTQSSDASLEDSSDNDTDTERADCGIVLNNVKKINEYSLFPDDNIVQLLSNYCESDDNDCNDKNIEQQHAISGKTKKAKTRSKYVACSADKLDSSNILVGECIVDDQSRVVLNKIHHMLLEGDAEGQQPALKPSAHGILGQKVVNENSIHNEFHKTNCSSKHLNQSEQLISNELSINARNCYASLKPQTDNVEISESQDTATRANSEQLLEDNLNTLEVCEELNSISNDVNRLLALSKQNSELEIKLQKLKKDVAEINQDHLGATGHSDDEFYNDNNSYKNKAKKHYDCYAKSIRTTASGNRGESSKNSRQTGTPEYGTAEDHEKYDYEFVKRAQNMKEQQSKTTTTVPPCLTGPYKQNVRHTAIRTVDYKKAGILCVFQNAINYNDEKKSQTMPAKQNRHLVVDYEVAKVFDDKGQNNKGKNNSTHTNIVDNSGWLAGTHNTTCACTQFNEQQQVIAGQEHQQPQILIGVANHRTELNSIDFMLDSVECQANKTSIRGKKPVGHTQTYVEHYPTKTSELYSKARELVDAVQVAERACSPQGDRRPDTFAMSVGYGLVSKSAIAKQIVTNEMLNDLGVDDGTSLHRIVFTDLIDRNSKKEQATTGKVKEYGGDFDKVFGFQLPPDESLHENNAKTGCEPAITNFKITPTRHGSPNSLSAKYRSLVMIKEHYNESAPASVVIHNSTTKVRHATCLEPSSDSIQIVRSDCDGVSAGISIVSSDSDEKSGGYEIADLDPFTTTKKVKKCADTSKSLEANFSSNKNNEMSVTSHGSNLNAMSLLTSQYIVSVDDNNESEPLSAATETFESVSRAKIPGDCLEDGLADDDSWVEEISQHDELEDDTTTPAASDSEDLSVDGKDAISVRDRSIFIDREEELRGYHRSAIDFTLHTIIEESCEESEATLLREDDDAELDEIERRQQRTINHHNRLSASDLEKYFFFGLGDGKVMNSVDTRGEDTASEVSTEYSEGLESVDIPEEVLHDITNAAELASSRLEKYFLSGFMGFSTATDKNESEESGSVGSDSEGHPSPSQRRKRLVRARGTPRSHNSSLDNLLVDGSQTVNNDSLETTLLGGSIGDPLDSSESEACDDTILHNSIVGEKTMDCASSDTTKRKKQVRKRQDSLDEKRLHETAEENVKLVVASECRTPTPGSMNYQSKKQQHHSRDSGFVGSNDDLLKTPDNEITECVRTKSPTGLEQIHEDKACAVAEGPNERISSHGMNSDITFQSLQSDGVTKKSAIPTTTSNNTGLVRKDSFNNWSSDEETNLMMSKMRQFFKTLVVATANAQQSSTISNIGKSSMSSSTKQSSACHMKTRHVQLAYFENELTRLMKTVPGINEEQVREIVEYLSSEDTWSDSYDSSDYTSSDLESVTSKSRKGELKEQISVSCQQIISKFEIDEEGDRGDGGLLDEAHGFSDDTTLVYQKLVASFSKIAAGNVSKHRPVAAGSMPNFAATEICSENDVDEDQISNSSARSLERSPQLFAKVMQHIGTRLVVLMHEVSSGNDTHGTNSPVPPQRHHHKRVQTKILVTTTEDEEEEHHNGKGQIRSGRGQNNSYNQQQLHFGSKPKDDANNLARSKSHDMLIDPASTSVLAGCSTSSSSTAVTRPHHHQSSSGVSDTAGEEYGIASDYERFSWRGSFESALLANGDSRTKLSQLDRDNSSSASALAIAKRRSAGDLLFNHKSLSREQLDRVRSCGSIGGGDVQHQELESSKPWVSSEDSKDLRRSSIPDELYESSSSYESSNFGTRSTLPRSLVGGATQVTSTNSLPRLPTMSLGATSTPITKSQNTFNYAPSSGNPKSARYRSPGIMIRASSSLGAKKSSSSLGLHNFLYSKKDARKRLTYFGEEAKAAKEELDSSPIIGQRNAAAENPLQSHGSAPGDHWPVQSDEDIDRLVAMHQNRNSLSSLGLRSDSMASVYSGAGEGRYGSVMVKGQVEFGMQYNYKLSALEIHMVRCKDLAAVDLKRNRSDPYVKIYLLPDKSKAGKRKTKVKKHTLNPIFDEVLRFHMPLSSLESRTLWLTVRHSDMFGRNDFLGEVSINLQGKVFDNPQSQWYLLQERSEPFDEVVSYRGDIVVGLKYIPPEKTGFMRGCSTTNSSSNLRKFGGIKSVGMGSKADRTNKGQLHVLVKEAKHLTPIKPIGTCDAFCKSYLLPDRTRSSKQKTPVVKRSLQPNWNYTFVYEDVSLEDLSERALELTVWDHDRLASNEFLGGVRFSLGSGKSYGCEVDWMDATGKEHSLWQNMLDRPNFWVESSLVLRSNLDGIRAIP